jgi:ubiquinone/menaquinone biosynthesis C-methylase UbiE
MALTTRRLLSDIIDLLDIHPDDQGLEIGVGPGVGIRVLAERIATGHVRGIDPSSEILARATTRNAGAVQIGLVELRLGSAEGLPFVDDSFDKVLAVNSMQVWRNPAAGSREIRRVTQPEARVALAFTGASCQPKEGLTEMLRAAGCTNLAPVEQDNDRRSA